MSDFIRDDLPTLLPQEPFEGFQGGPYGGVWYCTAFHPVPDDWPLVRCHVYAERVGLTDDEYRPLWIYLCPHCGARYEDAGDDED